jgi:biotin carboxyl carrier protein
MTKQNLIVNGKKYEVEVGDTTGSLVDVIVDGVKYSVEVPASVSMPKPAVKADRPAVSAKPAAAPVVRAAAPVAPSGSGNEVIAPMPGTILDVLVKVGDSVTKGQEVVSLEAMKMRNAIRSPKDGVVSGVSVVAGQKVKFNEILVQID